MAMDRTIDQSTQTSPRKALVADDQVENVERAKSGLEYAGYEVITAAQLGDVPDLARREGVSLILISVPSPPEDEASCAIARTMRTDPLLTNVPIIFLIGKAAARERLPSCVGLPGTSFIATPFHPVELVTLLKQGLVGQRPL
jgi:CheY-like chemotaxis protein